VKHPRNPPDQAPEIPAPEIQAPEIPPPGPGSVAAVVVTFHPDSGFGDRLASLLDQVGDIVVVDNGSCPGEVPAADDPTLKGRLEIIANGENRGLAAGLNQGLRRAGDRGFGWALTLDQDSSPLPNLVAAATRAFEAHPRRERLAAIGAAVVASEEPAAVPGRAPGPTLARAYRTMPAVITSGALHSIPAWERLGGFREDFFIDCVDTEFCLRARAGGLEIVQATEPALAHEIGIPSRKWVLGRWMLPTNHSPLRRYYVTRNRISIWRRYARSDGRFVLKDMRQSLREWIGIVFAESQRPAKLRAILAGLRDGALGKFGPRRMPRSPH
jgi:rhamnosyltransferase